MKITNQSSIYEEIRSRII